MFRAIQSRWNRITLRTKITGVTVLMLTLGLLVSGIGTLSMLRNWVLDQSDKKLVSIAEGDLSSYFRTNNSLNDSVFIALYDANGNLVKASWNKTDQIDDPVVPNALSVASASDASSSKVFTLSDAHGEQLFRAVTTLVTVNGSTDYQPVVVAVSMVDSERLLTAYLAIYFGFGIGVVILGGVLTRMLVTTTFAPLRKVEQTAAQIADGDLSQRMETDMPNTEVGRLNRSLNVMLNRIDRAFKDRSNTIDQMRRFVGDASHELRTPLVSVRGYAELYRMGALQTPEDVGNAMERIEKEAIRMSGLVEDLLELARIDEARPLELAQVDLVPIARDAVADTTAADPDRVITLATDVAEGVAIVSAEENKIRQVVTNLVTNALRYTPESTPIEIDVAVDAHAQTAAISVVDHGEGIPPQVRDKIFQRFWRADTSRARETGGSGLGLAIVSSLVAVHQGSVEVSETPGGGATFTVTLPLASSPQAPKSA